VAGAAGISVETLRKIETGRIPTPAFFTVVALARVLGVAVDDLAARCDDRTGGGCRPRLAGAATTAQSGA